MHRLSSTVSRCVAQEARQFSQRRAPVAQQPTAKWTVRIAMHALRASRTMEPPCLPVIGGKVCLSSGEPSSPLHWRGTVPRFAANHSASVSETPSRQNATSEGIASAIVATPLHSTGTKLGNRSRGGAGSFLRSMRRGQSRFRGGNAGSLGKTPFVPRKLGQSPCERLRNSQLERTHLCSSESSANISLVGKR